MTRILPVISGSKKVGKSTICINMAHHLAGKGYRTCLLSFDSSSEQPMAGIGIQPEYDLGAVLSGEKKISEILVRTDFDVDIVAANLGHEIPDDAALEKMSQLNLYMGGVFDEYDILILDAPSGITRQAVACALASTEIAIVSTPDETAMSWTYDLLAVLNQNGFSEKINVVINRCRDKRECNGAFKKLKKPAGESLGVALSTPFSVVSDSKVTEAGQQQLVLGRAFPDAPSLKGISKIASKVMDETNSAGDAVGAGLFWEQLSMIAQFPLDFTGVRDDGSDIPVDAAPDLQVHQEVFVEPAVPESAPSAPTPAHEKTAAEIVPQPSPAAPYQQASKSHQTIVSGGTVSMPGMDQAIDRLAEGIESISRELSILRKRITGGPPQVASGDAPVPPQRISLDFESYRAARQSSGKKK